MKIHLVALRSGPNEAGETLCLKCSALVFNTDGSIAYDTSQFIHTTDLPTYNGTAYLPDPPAYTQCT